MCLVLTALDAERTPPQRAATAAAATTAATSHLRHWNRLVISCVCIYDVGQSGTYLHCGFFVVCLLCAICQLSMATAGPCVVDCYKYFVAFLAVMCVLKFVGATGRATGFLVSVR